MKKGRIVKEAQRIKQLKQIYKTEETMNNLRERKKTE